jgi:retron-type reverse transcriptase
VKTHGNLYERIVSFENLAGAAHAACRGKRARPDVAAFEFGLERELLRLQAELRDQSYRPGVYYQFRIFEPKPRLISRAPFRDRVVHHGLCRVIEPLFEPSFSPHSYACRVGKGTHRALDRFQTLARMHRWALTCDIAKFFPSIDHQALLELLARKVRDRKCCWLIEQIVAGSPPQETVPQSVDLHRQDACATSSSRQRMVAQALRPCSGHASSLCGLGTVPYFAGDDLFTPLTRRRGLPIGNLTSQFFANVYLDPLDHFVERGLRCRPYVRYCDDFVLFSDSVAELTAWRRAIATFLERLRLRLHPGKSLVRRTGRGIRFLGFRVWPGRRLLARENVVRLKRRLRRLREAYHCGDISAEDLTASIRGWVAHAEHGDTGALRAKLLGGFTACRGAA